MSEKTSVPTWTFGDAYRTLAARQKPGSGVPFYTRVVNRRLGRVAAAAASVLRLTPNVISIAGAALWATGLAVLCLAPTSMPVVVLVVLLLTVSFGLDSADGQLARLTSRSGHAGEWLDHVLDAARHAAIHLAVAVALFRFSGLDFSGTGGLALLVPLAFALAATTRFFAQVLGEQLRALSGLRPRPAQPTRPGGSLLQLPADTGVLNASLLLLPFPRLFVTVYGALALANAGLLAATVRRRFAELDRLDRQEAR